MSAEAPPDGLRGRSLFASVQLGAYSRRPYAEGVLKSFRFRFQVTAEPPLRIHEVRVRGRQWFRVIAGPIPREEAQVLCQGLAKQTPCLVRTEPDLSP